MTSPRRSLDYCAKSMETLGSDDPDPRLLAGMVVGVEMAVIELWGRSGLDPSGDPRGGRGGGPGLDPEETARIDLTR